MSSLIIRNGKSTASDRLMKIFDLIARPYAMFYKKQSRQFRVIIPPLLLSLPESCISALDVGCGTGAMCQVLSDNGLKTQGCDRSAAMIKQAQRLTTTNIKYALADTEAGLPYADKSFDLVIASFVAHGMPASQRNRLYAEMKRVASIAVVLYDYGQRRHWVSDIMEFLEHGDYFSFIKVVDEELKSYFGNMTKTEVGRHAAWYIMKIKDV